MPGSLDLTGMLAALQGRRRPAPRDPLSDLAEAATTARARLAGFLPVAPAPPEPVARDRRAGT